MDIEMGSNSRVQGQLLRSKVNDTKEVQSKQNVPCHNYARTYVMSTVRF